MKLSVVSVLFCYLYNRKVSRDHQRGQKQLETYSPEAISLSNGGMKRNISCAVTPRNSILCKKWDPSILHLQNFSLTLVPISTKLCLAVDDSDVTFNLYTRYNQEKPFILKIGNDAQLGSSGMNFSNPTVMFFHGFTESLRTSDSQAIRKSFLKKGSYNVILVDSERLLAGLYYINSVSNCKYIGKFSAMFIDRLVKKGMRISDIHVIGFSLGAQIAGFVGQYITSGRLPRITGLDPAGPLYAGAPEQDRLDPSDAVFVDVIHSNGGLFGYKDACGHVDFFPNGGGPFQPGCSLAERFKNGSLNELVFCEHYRAYRLFTKSVNDPHRYAAVKCSNYTAYARGYCAGSDVQYMGYGVNPTARGTYFTHTGHDAITDD